MLGERGAMLCRYVRFSLPDIELWRAVWGRIVVGLELNASLVMNRRMKHGRRFMIVQKFWTIRSLKQWCSRV